MKQVTQLYQKLQNSEFRNRYPLYDPGDGKTHVLFIGTYLNGSGYYRHIVPAHELNQTDTHVAILSSLNKWNYNEQFGDSSENPIVPKLIEWADFIVLPPIFDEAKYFFQAIRDHNPNVQIVLDIDQNFHRIPKQHPAYHQFTEERTTHLLQNMAIADKVTLASEGLYYFYDDLLDTSHPSSQVELHIHENLLSPLAYESVQPIQRNESERVRIALVGGNHLSFDFQTIVPVLKAIKAKYKDKIEIVLFGWDGRHNNQNLMEGLEFVYEKSVRFTQYFDKLNQLAIDIALLPTQNVPYDTHGRTAIKYLELSASGIPVVASDLPPYNLSIQDEETGLLAEDLEEWFNQIKRLIENPEFRRTLGDNALKSAWYDYAYNLESTTFLAELFQ